MAMTLGQRIATARHAHYLTQQEVADRAGITRPQLANIEAGRSRPSIDSFAEICRAIGVDMDDIYWEDRT